MTDTTSTCQQGIGLYDRYPGTEPFKDNDVHPHLFFGRPDEIDHLLHRVRAVRLLILYGKSGLGKSSLLQAGLYPRLRERAFLPIPVRLNNPQSDPVQVVLSALETTCKACGVEYIPKDTSGLWEFFKSTDLWIDEVLQTPVLVFDQFEELFTLQSGAFRAALGAQLGELACRGLPTRLHQRVEMGERFSYSDAPPDVKLILSLREEYVGTLEDLVPTVPTVFEQRFRLAPLKRESARSAIVEPAKQDRPNLFKTRPFQYEEDTLNDMLQFLVDDQGRVEPFQLQILCRHAEQRVSKRQKEQDGDIKVDHALLGGHKAMETLIENFYRDALLKVSGWLKRRRARDLCEMGLLQDGHRVSIGQAQIRKQYKVSSISLEELENTRLIRKETRPGLEGFYYELSHDSVASAVMRSRRLLGDPRRLKTIGLCVLLGMSCLIGGMTWLWQTGFTLEQARLKVQSLFVGIHVEPEMQLVSAGTFCQGDTHGGGDKDERPLREVAIKEFEIGKFEVTFDEYDRFAIVTAQSFPHDQEWGRGRRPVINVSWTDARNYAKWLSQQTGKHYRLPTEAEWEYAARSENKDDIWAGTSQEEELDQYAVFQVDRTGVVGGKKPNDLGLYDMSGNVWEWVEDCRHVSYEDAPTDGSAWLQANGGDCGRRVFRGGSFDGLPVDLRTSDRNWSYRELRIGNVGFRLVRDLARLTRPVKTWVKSACK